MSLHSMVGKPIVKGALGLSPRVAVLAGVAVISAMGASPRTALAQCGLSGNYSGCCVNLEFRNVPTIAYVGETIDIDLFAESVNGFQQPIIALDLLLEWDPSKLRLVGRQDPCDSADSCFDCSTLGLPDASYNWLLSLFPRDDLNDRLNADCGADTFCSPYTGIPFNDGTALYRAEKQLTCAGEAADPAFAGPAGLWVTSIRFQVLVAGSTTVSIVPQADCAARQLRCHNVTDPDYDLIPCASDADCADNGLCKGGTNANLPCTNNAQCPGGSCKFRQCLSGNPDFNGLPCSVNLDCGTGGFCNARCTACLPDPCCTSDATDVQCGICSFASTRVIGGITAATETTCNLGPAATLNLSNCAPPTVKAIGPRYLAITPAATAGSVALFVQGSDTGVSCVTGYVRNDGVLINQPLYLPPSGGGGWNTIYLRGTKLIAGKNFTVRADCDANNPGSSLSSGVTVKTWRWADVDNTNVVDILDATRILDGFRSIYHTLPCTSDADCTGVLPHRKCDLSVNKCLWIIKENVDLLSDANCQPEGVVSILDVTVSLDAFRGQPDPCRNVCP